MILLAAMCLLTCLSYAQIVVVVNRMKVPQGGSDAYMANEREWKKIHQARVNEGKMIAWELFYIHNSGTDSPYNFATVDVYADLQAAMNNTITVDDFKKAWGEKYNDVLKKTNTVRNLAYSEMLSQQMGIQESGQTKYLLVSFMKAPDVGKYFEMEKKAYMPVHQIAINDGKMNGWSVWSRVFHEDNSYDAVTVNSFTSVAQFSGMNYAALFDKVKEGKSTNELFELVSLLDHTDELRTMEKTQLWELIEVTTPKK